jgi:hypothetical protein
LYASAKAGMINAIKLILSESSLLIIRAFNNFLIAKLLKFLNKRNRTLFVQWSLETIQKSGQVRKAR